MEGEEKSAEDPEIPAGVPTAVCVGAIVLSDVAVLSLLLVSKPQ